MIAAPVLVALWIVLISHGLRQRRRIIGWVVRAVRPALEEAISGHPARLRRAIRQGRLDARRRLLGEKKIRAFADLFPTFSARSEHGALPASKQVQRFEEEGPVRPGRGVPRSGRPRRPMHHRIYPGVPTTNRSAHK